MPASRSPAIACGRFDMHVPDLVLAGRRLHVMRPQQDSGLLLTVLRDLHRDIKVYSIKICSNPKCQASNSQHVHSNNTIKAQNVLANTRCVG